MPKRKTTKEFQHDLEKHFGKSFTILSKYKNNYTRVKIRHNTCGNVFSILPKSIIFKKGNIKYCPCCSPLHRKTTKEFQHEVYQIVGDEYSILSKYINTEEALLIRHNICGFTYRVKPEDFLDNEGRCPKCNPRSKLYRNTKGFKKRVFNRVGNKYSVLGEFKNTDTKIKIRHNVCGYVYSVSPSSFLEGCRCPKCAYKREAKIKTHDTLWLKEQVYKCTKDDYTLLTPYIRSDKKVKWIHNTCGNIFWDTPDNFLQGYRCPLCGYKRSRLKQAKTTKDFKKGVARLEGNNYTVLSKYKNTHTHIKMLHLKCGNKFVTRPSDFLSGCRCPYCKSSKGERIISWFLKKHNISYIHGYHLHNSSNKLRRLHLDFYLPSERIGIEFDGYQHFHPIDFSGHLTKHETFLNWQKIHARDKRKNKYCKNNNIKLIRIENKDNDNSKNGIKTLIFNTLKYEFL